MKRILILLGRESEDAPMYSPSPKVRDVIAELEPDQQTLAQVRLEAWALLTGAQPYKGKASFCLSRLANPRHRCRKGFACYLNPQSAALQHVEQWRGPQGEVVYTAHPGELTDTERQNLERIAAYFGAWLDVDPDGSWYAPGSSSLVVLWGRPVPQRLQPFFPNTWRK